MRSYNFQNSSVNLPAFLLDPHLPEREIYELLVKPINSSLA